jgi:hypothetical protein
MAYCYEYVDKLDQFGISTFNLKLKDTDGVLPDVIVPVSLYNNQISEEKLNNIAKDIVAQQTQIQSVYIIKPIENTETNNTIDNTVLSNSETTENILNTDII